jgi:hypothetical protein
MSPYLLFFHFPILVSPRDPQKPRQDTGAFVSLFLSKKSEYAKGLADARDAVGIHGKQKVVTGQGHVDICRYCERKGATALTRHEQR